MEAHALSVVNTENAVADPETPEALFASTMSFMESEDARGMTGVHVELQLKERIFEMGRLMLQRYYDQRSDEVADGPVVGADGVERQEERDLHRCLETLFGLVQVRRVGYASAGCKSLCPLDAAVALPAERYSHGVQRQLAEETAKVSFDNAIDALERTTAAHVPKRQAEQIIGRIAADFDAFYQQREGIRATEGQLVILSFDGKGITMYPEALRPATRKAHEREALAAANRPADAEPGREHRKRMATVAAVYNIEPVVRTPESIVRSLHPIRERPPRKRPKPSNKRVWASLTREPHDVVADGFAEALRRDTSMALPWIILVDGARHQLDIILELVGRCRPGATVIIDIIHVLEYLAKAGRTLVRGNRAELEAWVSEHLLEILRGRCVAVAASLRAHANRLGLRGSARESVDDAISYLETYAEFMRYDVYLAAGYPIATGVIEGACRYLVKDRMEITGARWCLGSAEAVLRLRSLWASGDLDDYWLFHERLETYRNHHVRYAANTPPETTKPKLPRRPPHLHLVS